MTEQLRVAITGAAGRMGAALVSAFREAPGTRVVAATERPGSPAIGQDAGVRAGGGALGVLISRDLAAVLSGVDVVVDFTAPAASVQHASTCADRGVPLVVGTTGMDASGRDAIARAAGRIPVVFAPNMSIGVNVLFSLAGQVARLLGDGYDAEIVETHHRYKKDAPSGTAVRLADVIAEARSFDRARDIVRSRDGQIGERPARAVGVQALRGGDVVGDHTVFFLGEGERIELTHRATSRANFAQGAVRAARWVVRQTPGLYDMQDVLGLRAGKGS